jgi:hypothetical protein
VLSQSHVTVRKLSVIFSKQCCAVLKGEYGTLLLLKDGDRTKTVHGRQEMHTRF